MPARVSYPAFTPKWMSVATFSGVVAIALIAIGSAGLHLHQHAPLSSSFLLKIKKSIAIAMIGGGSLSTLAIMLLIRRCRVISEEPTKPVPILQPPLTHSTPPTTTTSSTKTPRKVKSQFEIALETNNTQLLQSLLDAGQVPRADLNYALIHAVNTNNPDLMTQLLNSKKLDDITIEGILDHLCAQAATSSNLLKILLEHSNFGAPTIQLALFKAINSGDATKVVLLLEQPECSERAIDSSFRHVMLCKPFSNHHLDIIHALVNKGVSKPVRVEGLWNIALRPQDTFKPYPTYLEILTSLFTNRFLDDIDPSTLYHVMHTIQRSIKQDPEQQQYEFIIAKLRETINHQITNPMASKQCQEVVKLARRYNDSNLMQQLLDSGQLESYTLRNLLHELLEGYHTKTYSLAFIKLFLHHESLIKTEDILQKALCLAATLSDERENLPLLLEHAPLSESMRDAAFLEIIKIEYRVIQEDVDNMRTILPYGVSAQARAEGIIFLISKQTWNEEVKAQMLQTILDAGPLHEHVHPVIEKLKTVIQDKRTIFLRLPNELNKKNIEQEEKELIEIIKKLAIEAECSEEIGGFIATLPQTEEELVAEDDEPRDDD